MVIEHDGNRAQYLHIAFELVTFMDSNGWVPTVGKNFSKEDIILHHPRTARFVVFEIDKSTIAKLLTPPRQMLWNDMGMYIYCFYIDANLWIKQNGYQWP